MAEKYCGDCAYYEKCVSTDCPGDKDPHGHCYVNPPLTIRRPSTEAEEADGGFYLANVWYHGEAEVFADRPACRYYE